MWIDQPTFELPANVPLLDQSNTWTGFNTFSTSVVVNGELSAVTLVGDGSGITDLDADELTSGTVPVARLGTNSPTSSLFLRGDNTWAEALSEAQVSAIAARVPFYPIFTPTGIDDEFDDESFTGWTEVHKPAGPTLVETEINDVLSIYHPGADGAAELHAYLKAISSPATNDWWEICFANTAKHESHFVLGLILSTTDTWNTGSQITLDINTADNNGSIRSFTGFNSNTGTPMAFTLSFYVTKPCFFLRLRYDGGTTWSALVGVDGISWLSMGTGTMSITPAFAGFFLSTWGGTSSRVMSVKYFRKGNG